MPLNPVSKPLEKARNNEEKVLEVTFGFSDEVEISEKSLKCNICAKSLGHVDELDLHIEYYHKSFEKQ